MRNDRVKNLNIGTVILVSVYNDPSYNSIENDFTVSIPLVINEED